MTSMQKWHYKMLVKVKRNYIYCYLRKFYSTLQQVQQVIKSNHSVTQYVVFLKT